MCIRLRYFYLSGWIANLGVVPLFLFSAFLLAPAFFLLFLRMILVCLVFEAIILPYYQLLKIFRSIVLAAFRVKVKALTLFIPVILSQNYCIASSPAKPIIKYIRQGEQFSLKFPKSSQYSIGSKKVLKAKVLRKRRKILIKGVKAGLSDLIIWNSSVSKSYQIYVTHHEKKDEKTLLTRYLKSQGLHFQDNFDLISIVNEIQSKDQLKFIHRFCQSSCTGEVASNLSIQMITDIYQLFLSHSLPYIHCQTQNLKIQCAYRSDKKLIFQNELSDFEKYGISFQKIYTNTAKNIEVQFHLSQLESSNLDQLNLGFDRLKSQLGNLLGDEPSSIVFKNPLNLNQQALMAKSLAKPKLVTTFDSDNEIKVGREIPFESSNQLTQNIQWKFAGLKMKFKLYRKSQKIFIDYKATLSSQDGEQIRGNYKQSILALSPNQQNLLFEIDIDTQSTQKHKAKLFSKLPILGKLFRGKQKTKKHSKIIGTIFIKEMDGASL